MNVIQRDYFNLAFVSESVKTADLDNLSEHFLKDGAKYLSKLLVIYEISQLISSEIFPDSYKIAKLKPLYKKGSLTPHCNYRPMSLLLLISKVIEKVILEQRSAFLNSRNFLYTYQSGFQKKLLCLSYFNDKILKGFDKSMMTGMILIDLKKTFDTIDHDLLLEKLCT